MNFKLVVILLFSSLLVISCSKNFPRFDSELAFKFLEEQCSFGPRNPGSEGHFLCKEYILETLQNYGAEVKTQEFTDSIRGQSYEFTNIIASYFPERKSRIFLGAHWDTRPWADKDSLADNHDKPIIGANDAASGVAVLLATAKTINQNSASLAQGIDLLFFDAEDAGSYGKTGDWCLGSKYFAENYDGVEPEAVIIVDMIGDKNLQINIESHSYRNSPQLVAKIWGIADSYNFNEFKTKIKYQIYDDHYPFLEKGFNAIDIIDFDYQYWHTMQDTPDKCSTESLHKVGNILIKYIWG